MKEKSDLLSALQNVLDNHHNFLTYRQIAEIIGCSHTYVMYLIRDNNLHRPKRVSKAKLQYKVCKRCDGTTVKKDGICSKCSRLSVECAKCGQCFTMSHSEFKKRMQYSKNGSLYHDRTCWSMRKNDHG